MGIIKQLASQDDSAPSGRRRWREIFGATDKETPASRTPQQSWTRSTISSDAAVTRLISALRSRAPGGWSDDRHEQTTRHFVGIAYVAIHRIATQWQQAEFQVFLRDPNEPEGKRPVRESDPAQQGFSQKPYDLVRLLENPNNQDSFGKYLYRLAQSKYLTGTALTWMVPNAMGVPMELYPIPTATAIPQVTLTPEFPDGFYRIQPVYPYGPFSSYPTPNTAVGAAIPAQWMLKMAYPHPLLRYEGYSPLTGLRLNLDVIESIYRSRWYAMKRGFNPSAVLDMSEMEGAQPLSPEEIERIRADFEAALQGPENTGNLYIPAPGTKLDQWGNKPIDMDFANGWEQETSFALAGFGITKPAAGMIEDASYASLFATLKQLYMLTLKPDMDDTASELTKHLAKFFGDNLIVEIRCPRIDDHDIKHAKLTMLAQNRGMTVNELRKELDMPLTKEPWGNERVGEQQQPQGMPGMEAGPEQGGERQTMETADEGMESADEDMELAGLAGADKDEREAERERPTPGNLSTGALGPRKSLRRFAFNGNGKH